MPDINNSLIEIPVVLVSRKRHIWGRLMVYRGFLIKWFIGCDKHIDWKCLDIMWYVQLINICPVWYQPLQLLLWIFHRDWSLIWIELFNVSCNINRLKYMPIHIGFSQFSLVAQLCLPLCDPIDCSMPRFSVHHQLLELAQTLVHWVGDAILPSHPLSSLSPPAFNLSQDQGIFKWVSSASGGQSIGISASAALLPVNIQDWFPLGLTGWVSLQSKGLSRVFSNTTVQKHQFFSAQLFLCSNSHIHTWLLEKPQHWLCGPL